ncbi:hypothetical protein ACFL0F_00425 [Patescibacteria group bacterium]
MIKKEVIKNVKSISFFLPPILISIFPILSFYTSNISELSLQFLEKPLIYSVTMAIILTLLIYLLTKNKNKSAIITSLAIFIFYTYGHVSKFLDDYLFIQLPNGNVIGPDKIMLPLIFILFIFLVIKVIRSSRRYNQLIKFINISLIILITYYGIVIVNNEYRKRNIKSTPTPQAQNTLTTNENTPDIYHIVLDGYARQDILDEIYDYDNDYFISSLKDMGFYVADKARSNYVHTYLSLPSSLYMDYLDFLPEQHGKKPIGQNAAVNLMFDNLVSRKLKDHGYTTINFVSDWSGTNENYVADINYTYDKYFKFSGVSLVTSETNMVFLQTTLLSPFIKEVWRDALRGKILTAFEKLPDIPYQSGKKYTLAHILAPHPPYVFNADGSAVEGAELETADEGIERRGKYLSQVTYISNQTLPVLQQLIDNSENVPIIILQSDHGPASILGRREDWKDNYGQEGVKERSSILYAIYFPDQDYEELYPTITPINTYRILFNKYFDENLELLPDKTYFTFYEAAYDYIDVTNEIIKDKDPD